MDRSYKLFLIGYMGSGKTTIGKLLTKRLNLQFIDLDAFIENRYRKSIEEIFEEKGESGFRELERKALNEVAQFENIVVSTGGGTPCFFDNLSLMNKVGTTAYLKVSVDELARRLTVSKDKRPLIKGKNADELKIFITDNLERREPFYNQASHTFEVEHLKTRTDVDSVVDCLTNYLLMNLDAV